MINYIIQLIKLAYGYVFSSDGNNYNYWIDLNTTDGWKKDKENDGKNLYFPRHIMFEDGDDGNKCGSYWVSSAGRDENGRCIDYIGFDGHISINGFGSTTGCLRPIVCLKSNVSMTKDETGVWNLSLK